MEELMYRVRRLSLAMQRKAMGRLAGSYRSANKGAGLEFDEVRAYAYGDDIRAIDWNVTARTGNLHVKLYREERDLQLWILVDLSASMYWGSGRPKLQLAHELCALLSYAAIGSQDSVGLIGFGESAKVLAQAGRGQMHVGHLLARLLAEPAAKGRTRIGPALALLDQMARRNSLVCIVSDFLTEDLNPQRLMHSHQRSELRLLRVFHPGELRQPPPGFWPAEGAESGSRTWLWQAPWQQAGTGTSRIYQAVDSSLQNLKLKGIPCLSLDASSDYYPGFEAFIRQPYARPLS